MLIVRLNELPEVAGQNQLLDDPLERSEFDPVDHGGSVRPLRELMDMPEPPERNRDLLIHTK